MEADQWHGATHARQRFRRQECRRSLAFPLIGTGPAMAGPRPFFPKAPRSGGTPAAPFRSRRGLATAAFNAFSGDKNTVFWLLNAAYAADWQAFQRDGQLPKTKSPTR